MQETELYTSLGSIKDKINSLIDDLKAEVIVSELEDKLREEQDDYLIDLKGQFKRPFRKDVLDSEIVDYNYDTTQYLKINLSRDGIYDILPESVFHGPRTDKLNKTVGEMTSEYKLHKKEEEYARKFFSPFENEFFLKAVDRENLEKEILLELNGSKPIDFFYDFWGIERELPEILISKFIRILPYTYKIVGDLELTAYCLSYLLEEKVELAEQSYKELANTENEIGLGDSRLGLNMISGNAYMDYSLYLEFKIGPLKKSSFLEYIHKGQLKKIIELFYEYFLPMEVDVNTTMLLDSSSEVFNLNEVSILGITTRI